MQFLTGNRFLAPRSHENDAFASKNAPEVALCVGIVDCVLLNPIEVEQSIVEIMHFLVAKVSSKILVANFTRTDD